MNRRLFLSLTAAAAAPAQAASQPVYISDLSRAQPAEALARNAQSRRWRLLDYETEAFQGTMLVAGQNTHAPEIRIPLGVRGWHEIHFGVRSYAGQDNTRFQVRLSDEAPFCFITHTAEDRANRLDDYYWRTADLTGRDLVLRQYWRQVVPDQPDSLANPCDGVWLAYVKLVPLDAAAVAELEGERKSRRHRRLFGHHDAWSYTYTFRPTTADEIRRELEPFRDTDFARVYWEGGMGDRMYYPSKLGLTAADDWIEDPYRVGDRLAGEAWRALRAKGIDPFRVALDHVRSMGLEFHATYRPAGFHFPVPEDEWNTGGVYDKHPEWRGLDRRGRPTPRLSYAYPEVRQTALDFIREMAAYPVDGVAIAYNRRPPLIEYEPPVVETFRQKHGVDPRTLDEQDPRWLEHRSTFLTTFMRDLRKMLDPRVEITAIVMSSEKENLYFGLNLEQWVKEGLIGTLAPYSSVERINSAMDSWTNPADADFFLRITRGTKCKAALNLMPRVMPPETYRARAHALYQRGAEHLFFWDTNARYDFNPSWSALRRLGHKEEIARWVESGSPRLARPGSALLRLGGWDLRYATPG